MISKWGKEKDPALGRKYLVNNLVLSLFTKKESLKTAEIFVCSLVSSLDVNVKIGG